MLGNVLLKTIRDRWRGWMIAEVSMVAMLLMAMWAYAEIDMAIFEAMPAAYRSLIGLTGGMDVGALSVSVVMGNYGALVVASMALAMGAAAIAKEESKGTLGLLLGNPRSRTHVLLSNLAALVLFTAVFVVVLAAATVLSAQLLDVSLGELDVLALGVHLLVSSLFYGVVAFFIGAAMGNRGAAIGASVALMVVGFLGTGLLPLIEGGEDWTWVFPWHYFNGANPLYEGIDWGDLAVLGGATLVLVVGAAAGLVRRDLKSQSVGVTLLDRLREHPLTKKVADKLAGAARVSSIWFKTASDYQTMLIITAAYTFSIQGLMLGPFWSVIPEEAIQAAGALPREMLAFFGGGNMSTPEGFYQIETFGMMGPIVVMVLTIAIAQGALAGEESRRTMGLLLANPVSRSRVLAEKTFTMLLHGSLVGLATFAGVVLGSILPDLGMDIGNIAATCTLMTLVGLLFGAVALVLGAATGRAKVAMFGAIGAAVVTHLMNSLGEINPDIDWLRPLSPYYYYLGSDPLNNGMAWGDAAVLAAGTAVLIGVAFVLWQRRDIREGTE